MKRRWLRRRGVILLLILCCTAVHAQTRDSITIQFRNRVGNADLKLWDETFTNPFGEPFVLDKCKYYVSAIMLTDVSGEQTGFQDRYFLINQEDDSSRIIRLPYKKQLRTISFTIGVDSIRNVSGVQTGALDPVNAMFWTWNSGYVFAKLEGHSDSSHAPAHSFSWHIGGFRNTQNALRNISLTLPASSDGQSITIYADVLKWFNGASAAYIRQTPVCHQPGALAIQIADNYSHMFSLP